jgi:hypothetical protein
MRRIPPGQRERHSDTDAGSMKHCGPIARLSSGKGNAPMTNVFAVVGQHRAEPDRLLLLGDDGRYYAYTPDGQLTPADPADGWAIDDDDDEASGERREA